MRIRIVQKLAAECIDGIRLDQFVPGHQYEVVNMLGAVFLCEGWAEPVDDPSPALVIPLNEFNADGVNPRPTNLTREFFPSYYEAPPALVAERRRLPRSRKSYLPAPRYRR